MALPLAGTMAVTNGLDTFTWTGTPLTRLNCVPGATVVVDGVTYFIGAEPTDTTHGLFTRPYAGATNAVAPAEISQLSPDQVKAGTLNKRAADLFAALSELPAWADTIVEDNAARLALETESHTLDAGYRVVVRADGAIWAKKTDAYGDWIGPVEFKGDKGDKGDVGPRGVTPRGTYSGATAYLEGDTVLYNGSSWAAMQASTGNAPPVLPTTSNAYWQLLARRGTDGAGTGDMVGPASAADGNIVQFNGATGKLTKDGGKTFSDFLQFAAQTPTAAQKGHARANIGAGVLAGFRNQIINGDFGIWQRGTSVVISAGSDNFAGDRWRILNGTNQPLTALLYTMFVADLANFPSGVRSALRLNFTVAPTSGNVEVQQRIEDVGTLAGKRSTATGFVYFGGTGTTIQHMATQVFGVGGSPNADAVAAPITPVASTWAKVQALLDVPSLVGKLFGTSGEFLAFRQFITPRHATSYYLTRVSLVEGDATAEADSFAPRHPQQELALCQRYYEKGRARMRAGLASGSIEQGMLFKQTKRSTPTMTEDSPTTTIATIDVEGFTISETSGSSGNISWTADAEI